MSELIRMPFGKYKGQDFSDIPVAYLDWLIGQDWLKDDLKKAITAHLESRPEWHQMGQDE